MDISVRRNAYGRQVDSFEADLEFAHLDDVYRGVFWRTTRSYLDGSPSPFLVTRMPSPTLVSPSGGRSARRRVGFGPA